MERLADRTLIITGASMGLGRALALELARSGVNLVLNARHPGPLAEAARACQALGVKVRQVAGNAAQTRVVAELVAQALELGNFFGFVHVAGVLRPGPFLWELPPAHFQEVFESQVTAAYQLIRLAVPELLKRGDGLAVFFGSGAAVSNLPGIGAYCVAKAAEEHLARQLAAEAPQVTSFVFRPGVVDTRMQSQARQAKGGAAEVLHRVFRGYQAEGLLRSCEEQARLLVEIMERNTRRYHGRIVP
jgi:NAD(P)-dependent dehydrogenase (short-subunit alcohol dehydrogenase family)